jgi:hypothetical protein
LSTYGRAARSVHEDGDPAAEDRIAAKALAVLMAVREGQRPQRAQGGSVVHAAAAVQQKRADPAMHFLGVHGLVYATSVVATSAASDKASGWPLAKASTASGRVPGTPRRSSSVIASSGARLRSASKQEISAAEIRPPAGIGQLTARDDHQSVLREPWQEHPPEPLAESVAVIEGVDEEHYPGRAGRAARLVTLRVRIVSISHG